MADKLQMQLEVDARGVDPLYFTVGKTIVDDQAASAREKQLAAMLLVIGKAFNKLVADLETGNVTLSISESSIRRD